MSLHGTQAHSVSTLLKISFFFLGKHQFENHLVTTLLGFYCERLIKDVPLMQTSRRLTPLLQMMHTGVKQPILFPLEEF